MYIFHYQCMNWFETGSTHIDAHTTYRNSLFLSTKFLCEKYSRKIIFAQIFVQIKFVQKFTLYNYIRENSFRAFSSTQKYFYNKKKRITVHGTDYTDCGCDSRVGLLVVLSMCSPCMVIWPFTDWGVILKVPRGGLLGHAEHTSTIAYTHIRDKCCSGRPQVLQGTLTFCSSYIASSSIISKADVQLSVKWQLACSCLPKSVTWRNHTSWEWNLLWFALCLVHLLSASLFQCQVFTHQNTATPYMQLLTHEGHCYMYANNQ